MLNKIDRNSLFDFWYHIIGVNIIPFDSKNKSTYEHWAEWQDQPIPVQIYEDYKNNSSFDKGIAVIAGKIWRGSYKDRYLACIDLDNKKGIEEFLVYFDENDTLEKLSQKTIVEQHKDDTDRAHVYYIVEKPLTKKSGIGIKQGNEENRYEIPAIEVKSEGRHGTMIASPSIHKNGHPYEIIGTKEPMVLNIEQAEKLERVINKIYNKYSAKIDSKSNQIIISDLYDDKFVVYEGNNRHLQVLRFCESEFIRSNRQLTFDELLARATTWNEKHCRRPLSLDDVKKLVKQAKDWISNNNNNNKKSSVSLDSHEIKENENVAIYEELSGKIPEKKFAEYIINTCKKTVKREDALIRLILYAGLSSYTQDPLNLGIVAPTSEGKTYAVSEIMKFFPKQDVWMLGNMSPKVLIRDRGILVDKDNQPIQEEIRELNNRIRNEKDDNKKNELLEQRKTLYENSKMLIDISNKILVFLEPPHSETWDILKPILSHDTFEIEHPYVYKADKSLEVKHVVTRGWPACIFCSARDDSSWSMWPEIQSRFFIASPNMIKQKYQDSNILIGQKKGLPALVQEQLIVSKEDIDLAKECIQMLRKGLLTNRENNIWIPFYSILSESLPSEKGPDVRITNRIFSLLNLITKINAHNRPKLVYGNETLAISLLTDLEEVLKLTHNLSGLPSYKLEFFTKVFVPLYLSKEYPLEKEGVFEDKIALYTHELADYFKEIKDKSLTTDAIKKTYLTELKNNGLIDEFQSVVDKRKNGYYPIVDVKQFDKSTGVEKNKHYTNFDEFDNNLQFFKLKLSNNYNIIDENWLIIQILDLIKYGIGQTNIFELLDEENKETCICQFCEKYNLSGNLNRYFQSNENCIYSSKAFGKMRKM
jgi:hypothetical protein